MKIVLDSNVLLMAVGKISPYRPIWQAFIERKYHLILTEDIFFEYVEILHQRGAPDNTELVLDILAESRSVLYQHVYYNWNIISDPDDNKFFDAAIAGNADYLVTNDKHFNVVKSLRFPPIKIITAGEFLILLDRI